MTTVKKLLKSQRIYENLIQIEVIEKLNSMPYTSTIFINIKVNSKDWLTSKPVSLKLYCQIAYSSNFTDVKTAINLLGQNRKIKKIDILKYEKLKEIINL